MSDTPKIYSAMAGIMADMGAIGKEKTAGNGGFGFKFRGIDDVYNALHPLLAKHQVFILPEVVDTTRQEREASHNGKVNVTAHVTAKVKFTFVSGEDGSNISCLVCGEGMDTGDKATSKALSIAMKYAIFQTFAIPTEEMVDPDADIYEVQPARSSKNSTPKQASAPRQNAPQKPAQTQETRQLASDVKAKANEIWRRLGEAGFRSPEDRLRRISDIIARPVRVSEDLSMDDCTAILKALDNPAQAEQPEDIPF